MTRLPRAKGREIVRALEKRGFVVDRTRGSHVFLKHPDGVKSFFSFGLQLSTVNLPRVALTRHGVPSTFAYPCSSYLPYTLPSSVSRNPFICHLRKHRGCGPILELLAPPRHSYATFASRSGLPGAPP